MELSRPGRSYLEYSQLIYLIRLKRNNTPPKKKKQKNPHTFQVVISAYSCDCNHIPVF